MTPEPNPTIDLAFLDREIGTMYAGVVLNAHAPADSRSDI